MTDNFSRSKEQLISKELKEEIEMAKQVQFDETDHSTGKYGVHPIVMDDINKNAVFHEIADLNTSLIGKTIWVQGRVHTNRGKGKQCFIILRDEMFTVQCFASVNSTVSRQMIQFMSCITKESVIDVYGTIKEVIDPIEECFYTNLEIHVIELWVVSVARSPLPFQIEDVPSTSSTNVEHNREVTLTKVNQDKKLNYRTLDLRSSANQAIFRLQSLVCKYFRDILDNLGFIEIHTPKLVNAASEGDSAIFTVDYFRGNAYLAQSPQFYKQMAIAANFNRVYTIGSVFRAEEKNTDLHLTEFIGLDLEMAFKSDYHEVLELIEETFIEIFKRLKNTRETEIIAKQYRVSEFKFTEPALRLQYWDCIRLLREHDVKITIYDELSRENEKFLGRIIKEKYDTDFFVLDKYPLEFRPFYTMPDFKKKNLSNSFDIFMRGEEVLSGSQRIHDPDLLMEQAKLCKNINVKKIQSYIDAFRYGCPMHAGAGIGLERLVMLYLGLDDIRKTSMFPRDAKRLSP